MIRSEHYQSKHPLRAYLLWAFFYIALLAVAGYLFIQYAGSFRTYSVPNGTIELKIPYEKYLIGETIGFTVTNNYTSTVTIANNCPSEPLAVYKSVNKEWQRIHATSKIDSCSEKDRAIVIKPGKTISGSYKAWPALFKNPGKYRVVVFVEYFNTTSYQDFTVIKKPKPKVNTVRVPSSPVYVPAPGTNTSPSSSGGTSSGSASTPTALQSQTISVPGGGTVTVKYSSTTIYTQSISPNSGCRFEGGGSGKEVEIKFKCGENETKLKLEVYGGKLFQEIEYGDD